MQGYKPGRLHRVLDRAGIAVGLPKFFLGFSDMGGSYDDSKICSFSIHRGKSQRGGGYAPATVEAQFKGQPVIESLAGRNLVASMSNTAAADLAALIGTSSATLQPRGRGRVGNLEVQDRGDGRQPITTATAASWLNMNKYLKATHTPLAGQSLFNVLSYTIPQSEQAYVNVHFHGVSDTVATNQDPVTFADALSKYAQSPGILLRERRDGATDVMTIDFRKSWADQRLLTQVPLTRAQVLAPATWAQPNQEIGVRVVYNAVNPNDFAFTHTVDPTDDGMRMRETLEIDWGYIKTAGTLGQLTKEAKGIVYDKSPQDFRLPTVTIDILALIASGKSYHLAQVNNLLTLEAGDPVFLSADWPEMIQGVQFAEGVTEKIDSETWEIELSLLPYSSVTGISPSPVVPGRVWDSMPGRWDDQTKRWDEN